MTSPAIACLMLLLGGLARNNEPAQAPAGHTPPPAAGEKTGAGGKDAGQGVKLRHASAAEVFDLTRSILFSDDFAGGSFGTWRFSENDNYQIAKADPEKIKIVDAPGAAGQKAVQFTVKRGKNAFRSEISLPHEKGFQERWYAEGILIPKDWVFDANPGADILLQFHAIPGNGKATYPNAEISVQNHRWLLRRSFGSGAKPTRAEHVLKGDAQPGIWTNLVVHAKWSPGEDGLIEVWKDGQKVCEAKGPNVYGDIGEAYTPYLKTGIYHPEWHLDKPAKEERFGRENPVVPLKSILVRHVKVGGPKANLEDMSK